MKNLPLQFRELIDEPGAAGCDHTAATEMPVKRADLDLAAARACARIAPLWPLKHFVAVNPFLGLTDRSFADACVLIQRITEGGMLMSPSFYLRELARGRITDQDLQHALDVSPRLLPDCSDAAAVRKLLERLAGTEDAEAGLPIPTVADWLDRRRGTSFASLIVEEVAKWCSAYYDEGQSAWRLPWRSLPLYAAWKQAAALDRNPELSGLGGFRAYVAGLPNDPSAAVRRILDGWAIAPGPVEDFLHRQLMTIAGWSGFVQYRIREKAMRGEEDDSLIDLLAIRLAYDDALFASLEPAEKEVWRAEIAQPPPIAATAGLALLTVLQTAYEGAIQRDLMRKLAGRSKQPVSSGQKAGLVTAPALQAVFCIDVRSEVYRRALEALSPDIETLGFAGFFGFPIEYIPLGHGHGSACCPVLMQPQFRIRESVTDATSIERAEMASRRTLHMRRSKIWKAFKTSAVSCFSYVETVGLGFGLKLITDSFGLSRTVSRPATEGLPPDILPRLSPTIEREDQGPAGGRHRGMTGLAHQDRVNLARNALQAMGFSDRFAPLVLLCGHGSSTVNNPYGTALDCGACGGHSGEANARVAAAVLNDPPVRLALREFGITIPDQTLFIAGLHDTTTDEIRVFEPANVPETRLTELARLRAWLAEASSRARRERAQHLGIPPAEASRVEHAVKSRSRDWSQVRPEWGLAGNAALVVAPRTRTRDLNLNGRVFLHDYQHERDPGGSILELILTAPMVVASWINLQYYASTVNNCRFGSGNKTLHNVAGTLGVVLGNGGDLQVGLPWQSLHDGQDYRHEPVRLSVFVEAPPPAIERIILARGEVRQLVDNQWVHLFAMTEEGARYSHYRGPGQWHSIS